MQTMILTTYWKNGDPVFTSVMGSSHLTRKHSPSLDISVFLDVGLKHISMFIPYIRTSGARHDNHSDV